MPQTLVNHVYEIGQVVGVVSDPVPLKPTKFVIVGMKVSLSADGPQVKYQISAMQVNYSETRIVVTEAVSTELYAFPVAAEAGAKNTPQELF